MPARFVATDFFAGADRANESDVQGCWAGDAFAGVLNDRTENDSINAANSVAERIRNPYSLRPRTPQDATMPEGPTELGFDFTKVLGQAEKESRNFMNH